jgi:hypothetical protein
MRVLTIFGWATTALVCYLVALAAVEYGYWDDHPGLAAGILLFLIWWLVAERDALIGAFRRDAKPPVDDEEDDDRSDGRR